MNLEKISERLKTGNNVCILGAGTMGSGIAAHLANLGFSVSLLDLTQDSVQKAFERAQHHKPPHFFVRETAANIRLGSISENLDWVSEADWVCEVIIEKLDAKRDLYTRLEPLLSQSTFVSTNTSGLELALLAEGRSAEFKAKFLGTHFFNPPRYLKLLELIDTPDTAPGLFDVIKHFFEDRVARRVIRAKDTPGFIANRYGMWSMYHAIHVAEKLQLTPEQVDLITGPFLGRPRSASFRLNDIVGIDIMDDIARNQTARCPNDPFIKALATPKSVEHLLGTGNIGDKAGKGYYDRVGKEFFTLDLQTYAYRQRIEPNLPTITDNLKKPLGERLKIALEAKDEAGEFLRLYLLPTLRYADYLKNEIAYSVQDFDNVMQWGFGWEHGPFAMIDAVGSDLVLGASKQFYGGSKQLKTDESELRLLSVDPIYQSLTDYPVIEDREHLKLRDLGDGITNIEFKTKMGSVSPSVVSALSALLNEKTNERYVLSNPGRAFSVGFDLTFFLSAIESEDWSGIDSALQALQSLGEQLEKTKIVSALHGYALGGGLELAMSCPVVVALSDATIGMPEAKVGLIPGGRGVTNMRLRSQGADAMSTQTIVNMTEGKLASNAPEAKQLGFLRETDVICFHPDRLIATARETALNVKPSTRPDWGQVSHQLLGKTDQELVKLTTKGTLTAYDHLIGDILKNHFAKVESYQDSLTHEREKFLVLCRRPETKARIQHMLETGKPLRN
jgi:3-hydroxyacyl-CoA dehydrogenase